MGSNEKTCLMMGSISSHQNETKIKNAQVKGRVFVTVGRTPESRFDSLVKAVTSPKCLHILKKKGYSSLIIQLGNGCYLPPKSGLDSAVQIECFASRPNLSKLIDDHIQAATLVISHAGVETVFKTLRSCCHLVMVVENCFLGNYEIELGKKLSKFMHYCTPDTLVDCLNIMDTDCILPYPPRPPPFNALEELLRSLQEFFLEGHMLAPFEKMSNHKFPSANTPTFEKLIDQGLRAVR